MITLLTNRPILFQRDFNFNRWSGRAYFNGILYLPEEIGRSYFKEIFILTDRSAVPILMEYDISPNESAAPIPKGFYFNSSSGRTYFNGT
jgi:hypothetical protein